MQTMAMEGMTKLSTAIRSCALHPDGSQLACGLTDGSFVVLKTKYVVTFFHFYFYLKT
jgi:hypothetical protein